MTEGLAKTTNITDPHVIFDPKYIKTDIIKNLKDMQMSPNNPEFAANQIDMKRVDGILVPIVKINSMVVENIDLEYMNLKCIGFKPTIDIIVTNASYLKLETPSMANKITVVLIPPEDGTYRKISVDFYITSYKEISGSVKYTGEFFFPDLEKKYTKFIKKDGNNKLTTYDLLEEIAKLNSLGFAATDMCKDIMDNKLRLVRDQNYQEVIQEHISFAGLDNNSIFLSWIDLYGYLTMCNIAWVINKSVNINELSIKNLKGINLTDSIDFPENGISFGEDTYRTITNWKTNTEIENNKIASYEWIINNAQIKINGTDNNYYIIDHLLGGGGNNISTENIVIVDDKTADGINYKEAYKFQQNKYIGVELGNIEDGNTPVLYQEKRRDAFLSKYYSRKLRVSLKMPNYGITRGILINVNIFEYDRQLKTDMLNNLPNASLKGDMTTIESEASDLRDILESECTPVPNLTLCGIYYVDGVEFIYEDSQIEQVLYLIKQQPMGTYINASSVAKYKDLT